MRFCAVQVDEVSRSILIPVVKREPQNLLTRTSVNLPDHFLAIITLQGVIKYYTLPVVRRTKQIVKR